MDDGLVSILLITANVGSIFEDPESLMKIWVQEVLSKVSQMQPKFFALHCQEVGGKNYTVSMKHVEEFVRELMASDELQEFGQVRVYLDEDFTSSEKFTALGSIYFIHNSLKDVQIWDFQEHSFFPVEGKEVFSGNIERVSTKEKSKFPQEFFPECKWSRKGFMRTRWNLCGTIFDLINIHLFHDASNFVAMESFPSVYSKNRQNALAYVLHRFATDNYAEVPYFIFGDFNFRLDTKEVVQKLASSAIPVQVKSAKNGEVEKILYKDKEKVVLALEKKVFDFDSQDVFLENGKWLQEFDKELEAFEDQLFELNIDFPPSYPFQEDLSSGTLYMKTRCPAWCDRILLNKSARNLISIDHSVNNHLSVQYELVGGQVAMGDHKPVMLLCYLQTRTGMLSPFISKSSLEACILWSCIPNDRNVSSPRLFCSSEPILLNRRPAYSVNHESIMLSASESSPCEVCPIVESPIWHSVWPFRNFINSYASTSNFYMPVREDDCVVLSESVSFSNDNKQKNNIFKLPKETINEDLSSSCIYSHKDSRNQQVSLHAIPSINFSGNHKYSKEEPNCCTCCPCVLL